MTSSTCDSESLAVQVAVQYVEYVRYLLEDLGCKQSTPTPVYNYDTATVALCIDPIAHNRSVQMTRAMAYVRERTVYGVIAPLHVRTTDQAADFLTKRLDCRAFDRCCALSGLQPSPD